MKRRVAFFGSPAWAVPALEALQQHHLLLAVTQPDKPAGRGLQLTPCPVAQRAQQLGIALAQPNKVRNNPGFWQSLRELNLDVAVTAAYGKILPPELLAIPRFGFLNIHPSDLPKYRGPAPVQWSLINGETQTAVCVMQTDAGMDTGPIVARWHTAIETHENAETLSNRLRDKGIELLLEALQNLEALPLNPQQGQASHAPMLDKDTGRIRFGDSALAVYNRHRGVQPWPGSWFEHQGKRIKVLQMQPSNQQCSAAQLASITPLVVGCATGSVELLQVQPEGKKAMPGSDWARGVRLEVGQPLQTALG